MELGFWRERERERGEWDWYMNREEEEGQNSWAGIVMDGRTEPGRGIYGK